jgi:hypothetical protein
MEFNSGKESTLEMLGIAGLAGTVACTVQQMICSRHYILTLTVLAVNLVLLVGYFLLMKQRSASFIVLLVGGSLFFLLQAFFMAVGLLLWLSFLMLIFAIITIVVVYFQELHLYMRASESNELVFAENE